MPVAVWAFVTLFVRNITAENGETSKALYGISFASLELTFFKGS